MSVLIIGDIVRAVIAVSGCTVCYNAAGKPFVYFLIIRNVSVDYERAVFRQQFCELAEGVADIFQIFKEFQMIFLDVKDHADLWEEMKETVRVLACFRDKSSGMADADISSDCFQDSAHGDCGIQISCQQDV